MSAYTFPDSGREVELERVSFTTLSLLRAHYQQSYPNKPSVPIIQVDDMTEENPNDPQYLETKKEWERQVNRATWLATQLLYAKHIRTLDEIAVQRAIADLQEFGADLKEQIRLTYREAGVPFDESVMEKYIYLWCICVTSSGESNLFNTFMTMGSGPTQEQVQKALWLFRPEV